MNTFQPCRNTSDSVPLYLPQQLFLKPAAQLTISIQLPNLKKLEKSISHWEIMERLRGIIKPDEFSVLKVSKSTIEFVRFEAEIDNKTRLDRVVSKLDNNSIKLNNIPDLMRVKAAVAKSEHPTRQKWDDFFQEAKDMDELKPGQRPDTIHFSNLPKIWFVPRHSAQDKDVVPSEKMFFRIFEKFGTIRYVDIPICDPYRKKMKEHISGIKEHLFDDKEFFEGYVQFKDYQGFTKTMDAFKGMKLMRKEQEEALCVNIKVDFDRSKHLSDASIRRREIVRDRLVQKQKDKEENEKNELDAKKTKENDERQKKIEQKNEKEERRRKREEKRKAKLLEKLKIGSCDEINDKIAKEEKKLLKAQRKLEAIRLVEELFHRIKDKKDQLHMFSKSKSASGDELKKFKNMSELEVLTRRQKLHNAIEGRVVLKNILSKKRRSSSSSSDTSLENDDSERPSNVVYEPHWYAPCSYSAPIYPPPLRGGYHMYPRNPYPGPSRVRQFRGRGFRFRNRGGYRGGFVSQYPPGFEEEYARYFSKFLRRSRSRSRRSRSRSRSDSRSSRSYSRSRSRTRSRRSHSYRRSKSRSSRRSVDSSKFVSPRSLRRRKRRSRSSTPRGRRSRSRSPN